MYQEMCSSASSEDTTSNVAAASGQYWFKCLTINYHSPPFPCLLHRPNRRVKWDMGATTPNLFNSSLWYCLGFTFSLIKATPMTSFGFLNYNTPQSPGQGTKVQNMSTSKPIYLNYAFIIVHITKGWMEHWTRNESDFSPNSVNHLTATGPYFNWGPQWFRESPGISVNSELVSNRSQKVCFLYLVYL